MISQISWFVSPLHIYDVHSDVLLLDDFPFDRANLGRYWFLARNRWRYVCQNALHWLRNEVFFRHGVPTSLSLRPWKIITFRNFRQRRAYPVGMQADRSRAGGRGVTVRWNTGRWFCNSRPIRGVAATQTHPRVVVYVENPAKRQSLSTCHDIYRDTRRHVLWTILH